MRSLILIGFLFASLLAMSAPVNHSGVIEKNDYTSVDIDHSTSIDVVLVINDSVDYGYSSVAIIPTFTYEFNFVSVVGYSNHDVDTFEVDVLIANKGSPKYN